MTLYAQHTDEQWVPLCHHIDLDIAPSGKCPGRELPSKRLYLQCHFCKFRETAVTIKTQERKEITQKSDNLDKNLDINQGGK